MCVSSRVSKDEYKIAGGKVWIAKHHNGGRSHLIGCNLVIYVKEGGCFFRRAIHKKLTKKGYDLSYTWAGTPRYEKFFGRVGQ